MDDISFTTQANIGSVSSFCGELTFSFIVHSSGNAHLKIYAYDPSDLRKSGVLLNLDEGGYHQLKKLITKIDKIIESLRTKGQMKKMIVQY